MVSFRNEVLKMLITRIQSIFDKEYENSRDKDCSICLCKIDENDLAILQCSHSFHYNCIKVWLKSHNTCCYCRAYVDGAILFNDRKLLVNLLKNLLITDVCLDVYCSSGVEILDVKPSNNGLNCMYLAQINMETLSYTCTPEIVSFMCIT